ncbi:tRNA pseudouridine32 synthase/23S rRNA pseudouridine746 synthase [Rarobacter faecitabidus]|uniref:RNA pseudouridylate synthase n=1 Tax=Rarobacter faecitabidus TaxID=13243 RepID=A0A542ZXE9_RARFA|nr:tRNA pseudouridine32 synthase/23S rRNA pseudouridine746 synthase [Rarobacter faecitabidus]
MRLQIPLGSWSTLDEYLAWRLPDDLDSLPAKFAAREVVDELGRPLNPSSPAVTGSLVYLYRDPPPEVPVPFEVEVLYQDPRIVVIDKPHFLATTPRGSHIRETALVRVRTLLDLPELSPVHRLDRLTAGVLVLTTRREYRGPYQTLFQQREVDKTYEAVAALRPDLELPRVVRSRMQKIEGVAQAYEEPGQPNSETLVEIDRELGDGLARYRLTPHTGKTHQLRVHMASLGIGILGDPLYPEPREVAIDDFSDPLQLLAKTLRFTDPLTARQHEFVSTRQLAVAQPASVRCEPDDPRG